MFEEKRRCPSDFSGIRVLDPRVPNIPPPVIYIVGHTEVEAKHFWLLCTSLRGTKMTRWKKTPKVIWNRAFPPEIGGGPNESSPRREAENSEFGGLRRGVALTKNAFPGAF